MPCSSVRPFRQSQSPRLPAFFEPLLSFPTRRFTFANPFNTSTFSFCTSLVSPITTDLPAVMIARCKELSDCWRLVEAERVVWEVNRRDGGEARWFGWV